MSVDPVTIALVQNRLDHIARQMGWVMLRTSKSPIFSQSHDFSCFIADGKGQLLSQADGILIHTGGGGFAVRALLKAFGGRIREGDVFLSSDPYAAGGNHLPDWVIFRPVFVRGACVAFVCNRAHQSDIGGGAAGTYNAAATDIFQEGIRLPPLKLVDGGEVRDDLWQLLLLNSRTPHLLDGDLRAMVGSTKIGAQRVAALVEEIGAEAANTAFDAVLDHAERRMRQALRGLPPGTYRGAERTDNDCFESKDIWIRVAITIGDGEATVDFTGSDPQMKGFKNSTFVNTHAAVYVAFGSFFEPSIPKNEGTYRCLRFVLPEGSIVNPRPPAPQTMSTVLPSHEIIHACWVALGQADAARSCAGWGKITHASIAGKDEQDRTFVMYHWGALPAAGAVAGRDGFNQTGHLNTLGHLMIPNAEAYEQLYPVRFVRQEFRRDGGGAGEFRGGTGIDYEVEVEASAEYSFRGEGARNPTGYGVGGGKEGAVGIMTVAEQGENSFEPPQFGIAHLGPARFAVASPGGGGWGDPLTRDPSRVLRDVRDDVVSVDAARALYGVVLNADGLAVDAAATAAERAARGRTA